MRRRAACAGALALVLGAVPAFGGVVRVPEERPSVQAGILAASPGDTVLVAPGRYRELILLKPGVRLIARDGPDSTVLVSPGLGEKVVEERLLEIAPGGGRDTIVEGFTLDPDGRAGCGIYVEGASPTIRGNRFLRGFGWGIHLRSADARIEDNVIRGAGAFGLLCRGSSPEIFRNTVQDCIPRAIAVSGKNARPLIGGSAENANRFFGNGLSVVNGGRNDIDATWNDWGWETAVEMDRKGYPEDITTISDGNDTESPAGRGKVDYRHWVTARGPAGRRGPGGAVVFVAALVLAGTFVAASRRRRA